MLRCAAAVRSVSARPTPARATGSNRLAALLDRTWRWPIASCLAFRVASGIGPVAYVYASFDWSVVFPVLCVALLLVAANVVMGALLLLRPMSDPLRRVAVTRWIVADLVVAVAVNLWSALVLPGAITEPYHDVFWFYLMGTVMLWTGRFGPLGGAVIAAGSIPLQLGMVAVGPGAPTYPPAITLIGRSSWLAVGLFASWLILLLVRNTVQVALDEGIRAGRHAEQVRTLRALHDTVLQTLEGIVLFGGNPAVPETERLTRVVAAARRQSADLRETLDELAAGPPGTLTDYAALQPSKPRTTPDAAAGSGTDLQEELATALAAPAEDLARLGVRVDVDSAEVADVRLSPARSEAVRSSAHEALVNVVRHAQASHVTVRATTAADQVQVVVQDDGHGFDPREAGGFGIQQSILGRLRDVGGDADVHSVPHHGTRVTMWVPADERDPRRPASDGRRSGSREGTPAPPVDRRERESRISADGRETSPSADACHFGSSSQRTGAL
jgi:signal transduction histidine kinase